MDGKMTILHHGFTIDAHLVKRVLFGGNPIIGRYDELLTQMLHLRTYLPNYLGRAQAIDTITGQVPQRASEWVFGKPDGTFGPNLEKFLRFEFASVDWLADAVKLKNMLYGTNLGWLHAADRYVVVAALELVKDFMHRTIVAAGGPALPANAHDLTVLTFFEFYIEHVKMANCLSTRAEQRSWLTHASQQCTASLRLMGLAFRDHVNSTSSKSTPLVLLSKDSPPYQNLVGRQRSLKTLVEHKEAFGWVRSRKSTRTRRASCRSTASRSSRRKSSQPKSDQHGPRRQNRPCRARHRLWPPNAQHRSRHRSRRSCRTTSRTRTPSRSRTRIPSPRSRRTSHDRRCEQPDTIFDDHAGIKAVSLNMRAFNGSPSKYVRLIRRNCAMPAPPHTMTTFAAPHDPQRTQHAYPTMQTRETEFAARGYHMRTNTTH